MKLSKFKIEKIFVINLGLSLFVAFLTLFFSNAGNLKQLQLAALDLSFQLKGHSSVKPNIIIVEVTDADIAKVGRWPWDRTWHAAMAQALKGLGAKEVYFDILFPEPSTGGKDAAFSEVMKSGHEVYLPFAFQGNDYNIKKAVLPLESFARAAKGIGAINIYPDSDGIFRKIPLVFKGTDGKYYPHVALKIALDYAGLKIKHITRRHIVAAGEQKILKIPLIEKNTLLLNWLGRWQDTFKHYSYLDVLAKYKDYLDGKISASEIKDFKNSICLVAVTAIGLYDIKPIPIQPEYPGIGILATTINNLLTKNFIYTPPAWINIFLLFALALLPAFIVLGEKPLRENLIIFLIGVSFAVICIFIFNYGFYIDIALPLAGLFLSNVMVGIYNFVRISVEKQQFFKMAVTDGLTGLYNIRYFKMLIETEIMLSQPDLSKKFAIIMSDVDHFKHFNDTYGHQVGDIVLKEVANVLKTTVRVSDVVARYGGEEMILLLRGADLKGALIIGEKLRKNVEDVTIKDEKASYKVTASFGVAIYRQGDTTESLVKRADEGLYKAKENGRNRVTSVENIASQS